MTRKVDSMDDPAVVTLWVEVSGKSVDYSNQKQGPEFESRVDPGIFSRISISFLSCLLTSLPSPGNR